MSNGDNAKNASVYVCIHKMDDKQFKYLHLINDKVA